MAVLRIYVALAVFQPYCPVWSETWIVQPRKFISPKGKAWGRQEFSGLNKSSCLSTKWAINCLLHRKLKKHNVIKGRAKPLDMMSAWRYKDLSQAHMTSLDQSYFFICHFDYTCTWYNKFVYCMICPFIKPFYKFSSKTSYITLFTPVSRFFASDVISKIIMTLRKAWRFRAIFVRNFLKIHSFCVKYWYFQNYHVI